MLFSLVFAACGTSGDNAPGVPLETIAFAQLAGGGWTPDSLRAALTTSDQALAEAAQEPDTFTPSFLRQVSDRHVVQLRTAEDDWMAPMTTALLRDIDGRPSAFVATYARNGADTSPTAVAKALNALAQKLGNALEQDDLAAVMDVLRTNALSHDFVTVITGATPTAPRLVALRDGLPPMALRRSGRAMVRSTAAAGALVKPIRAFYEPRMTRGEDVGLLYRVKVGGSSHTVVWLVPGASRPTGQTMSMAEYRQRAHEAGSATTPANGARRWGRLAAALGHTGAWSFCPACGPASITVMNAAVVEEMETLFGNPSGECDECVVRYADGSEVSVETCDDAAEACCDWVDGEYVDDGDCIQRCTCTGCQELVQYTSRIGHILRGVPVFYQFDYDDTHTCGLTVAVGCGPIAVAEWLAWYDQRGHNDLLDAYREGNELDWKLLTADLRDNYLGTECYDKSEGKSGSWTQNDDMPAGIRAFLKDQGYASADIKVHQDSVKSGDVDAAFKDIQDAIDGGDPVMIGYCIGDDDCNGLGERNHLALITGYFELGPARYVYIDKGWGTGNNEIVEFTVTSGSVRLHYLTFDVSADGDDWCAADWHDKYYTYTPAGSDSRLGWSAEETEYLTAPVCWHITGARCDLMDIERDVLQWREWNERVNCLTPAEQSRIDETFGESQEDLGTILSWQNF